MAPIKRHEALKSLSRDHHHGLLLCYKIREAIRKDIPFMRIKKYTDWFFKNHLQEHFQEEEEHVFPIIGNENPMVKKAIVQHRKLERLFLDSNDIERAISLIEEELEQHIRFEERQLFNVIQEEATDEQLQHLIEILSRETTDPDKKWGDHFWK